MHGARLEFSLAAMTRDTPAEGVSAEGHGRSKWLISGAFLSDGKIRLLPLDTPTSWGHPFLPAQPLEVTSKSPIPWGGLCTPRGKAMSFDPSFSTPCAGQPHEDCPPFHQGRSRPPGRNSLRPAHQPHLQARRHRGVRGQGRRHRPRAHPVGLDPSALRRRGPDPGNGV